MVITRITNYHCLAYNKLNTPLRKAQLINLIFGKSGLKDQKNIMYTVDEYRDSFELSWITSKTIKKSIINTQKQAIETAEQVIAKVRKIVEPMEDPFLSQLFGAGLEVMSVNSRNDASWEINFFKKIKNRYPLQNRGVTLTIAANGFIKALRYSLPFIDKDNPLDSQEISGTDANVHYMYDSKHQTLTAVNMNYQPVSILSKKGRLVNWQAQQMFALNQMITNLKLDIKIRNVFILPYSGLALEELGMGALNDRFELFKEGASFIPGVGNMPLHKNLAAWGLTGASLYNEFDKEHKADGAELIAGVQGATLNEIFESEDFLSQLTKTMNGTIKEESGGTLMPYSIEDLKNAIENHPWDFYNGPEIPTIFPGIDHKANFKVDQRICRPHFIIPETNDPLGYILKELKQLKEDGYHINNVVFDSHGSKYRSLFRVQSKEKTVSFFVPQDEDDEQSPIGEGGPRQEWEKNKKFLKELGQLMSEKGSIVINACYAGSQLTHNMVENYDLFYTDMKGLKNRISVDMKGAELMKAVHEATQKPVYATPSWFITFPLNPLFNIPEGTEVGAEGQAMLVALEDVRRELKEALKEKNKEKALKKFKTYQILIGTTFSKFYDIDLKDIETLLRDKDTNENIIFPRIPKSGSERPSPKYIHETIDSILGPEPGIAVPAGVENPLDYSYESMAYEYDRMGVWYKCDSLYVGGNFKPLQKKVFIEEVNSLYFLWNGEFDFLGKTFMKTKKGQKYAKAVIKLALKMNEKEEEDE